MEKSIQNFPKQFAFQPKIHPHTKREFSSAADFYFRSGVGVKNARQFKNIIVAGMGGSAFPVGILKIAHPELNIRNHRDYGLPRLTSNLQHQTLVITSSYSGNTEETLSSFKEARKRKIPVAVLTVGGKLLALAKKYKVPYIQIPNTGVQPRAATGFVVVGLSKLIGLKDEKRFAALAKTLKPNKWEKSGKALSENLWDQVPIIYSSARNFPIAYNWKIRFNENTKIPAFANFFPELNHNEMTGFDVKKTTSNLSSNFHLIFLEDAADHPQIRKRFAVTKKLLTEKGISSSSVPLVSKNIWEKIFNSILLADWTSFHLAKYYGVDPEPVPMVEEFKKLIK